MSYIAFLNLFVCLCVRVTVSVLVYATLLGPNIPTRIVKPAYLTLWGPACGNDNNTNNNNNTQSFKNIK